MSADKLEHALTLCAQAGLLTEANGGYRSTTEGKHRRETQ